MKGSTKLLLLAAGAATVVGAAAWWMGSREGTAPNDGAPAPSQTRADAAAVRTPAPQPIFARSRVDDARPDILFVVFDATRADRLLPWGGRMGDDAVARLAREGVVFERAFSASSWTSSASASFFTSTYPSQHQVLTGYAMARRARKRRGQRMRPNRVPAELETLPELLRRAGYRTYGVSDNLNICAAMGFDRGFDHFVEYDYRGADAVNAEALESLRNAADDPSPIFLYVHYMDPHQPYHRRETYYDEARSGGAPFAAYDSELGYADAHLAALMTSLGVNDDTLVVFLADHGEEFRDHGRTGHTNQLYMELVHVPLIVRWPGRFTAHRVRENVSTIDLLPTLHAVIGARTSTQDRGIDLGPAVRGEAIDGQRALFAMRVNELLERPLWRRAVLRGDHEYIWSMPSDRRELYDFATDEAELHNLATDSPETVEALHHVLTRELETAPVYPRTFAPAREVDDAFEGRLRALGYAN